MTLIPMGFAVWSAALLGGIVVALDRVALKMIQPFRKRHKRSVKSLPFPVRPHPFSSLGQPLTGWFVDPITDVGGPVVVLVHGWGSSHGRMTYLARPLLESGYPVFLFDVRHHGESPEAPFVTIRHFRDDTRAAVREVEAAFPNRPVVLIGHSMGGSAAVLAVAEGAPVEGVVTIAAPAELWGVWADSFDKRGLPGRLITRILRPFWRLRAGESFSGLRPEERVREINIPFLVLHGDSDMSVAVTHAHLLAAGAGLEAVVLPGEDHNEILGKKALHLELFGFLESVSGPES